LVDDDDRWAVLAGIFEQVGLLPPEEPAKPKRRRKAK
jgi:hypothetical protein